MTISDIATTLSETQTFAELLPIVRNASAEFSFWGARYVSVEGYGSVSISTLTEKVNTLVHQNYEFDETERACGKEVVSLIDRLYVAGDEAFKHSCFLSKLFYMIRLALANIFNNKCCTFSTRFYWEHGSECAFFEYYTRQQYINVFKTPPPSKSACQETRSNRPERWHTPTKIIYQ